MIAAALTPVPSPRRVLAPIFAALLWRLAGDRRAALGLAMRQLADRFADQLADQITGPISGPISGSSR